MISILIFIFISKGAYVDFKRVIPSDSPIQHLTSAETLQSEAVFNAIEENVKANVDKVKRINGVFLYIITKNGQPAGKWSK